MTTAETAAPAASTSADWPALPLDGWQPTYDTLHLWTQMVGKTRLALSPMENHWWQVALYVTPRGLTTSPIPHGRRTFEVAFDFVDHLLVARTSDGDTRTLPLEARPVADFYRDYVAMLGSLGLDVHIRPHPSEIDGAIPFPDDRVHAAYDPDAAQRCWRVMVQADRVMKRFRGRFLGKCSPVHFWWGAFDLACTRFSGRPAPRHPGGVPNLPDYVAVEGYSHECISAGWWPGGGALAGPAFYAYAYPEPPGCPEAPVRPGAAYYHPELHEWILPYDAVREAADPDATLLDFLQSTYEVAANLGGWDRAALERPDGG
ncbi:MAG TPA: DUF5996 family protein [Longimicrobium sp.]|jgi:hypothetical protein|nr:DUF5996 family protein [Longimicrobium sp.]